MRIARNILSAVLVLAVLASGLPLFSPEDANRDTRVNLEDAILHVRGFAGAAEDPAAFESGVKKALATLYAVAGLNASIRAGDDAKAPNTLQASGLAYLVPSDLSFTPPECFSRIPEKTFHYESNVLVPVSPPPETA